MLNPSSGAALAVEVPQARLAGALTTPFVAGIAGLHEQALVVDAARSAGIRAGAHRLAGS